MVVARLRSPAMAPPHSSSLTPAPRPLGGGRIGMELGIFSARPARWAGGAAIDPGGAYGIDEGIVRGDVAGQYRGTFGLIGSEAKG